MQYREFGKTGERLSILGFGAMRLPVIDDDSSKIDYDKSIEMVRYAIDNGVNYLDTAYPYHGGKSEAFCAAVMKDGYREKIKIATKSPVWDIKKHEDFYSKLDEQLSNLEVSQIDFYLLHALNTDFWETIKKNDYKEFLRKGKEDGKIKYAGFSFHDDLSLFKEIVDDYDWDFCQIQLNYMDENYQAGLEGLKYASAKGMGIIIMEPLRGGLLAKTELPEAIKKIYAESGKNWTPAQWALKYLWNMEDVGVVLSGMSTIEQAKENVAVASESTAGSLTDKDVDTISKVKDFYYSRIRVNCTRCKYCMPCPAGVNIPDNLWAYNNDAIYDDFAGSCNQINMWMDKSERASNCVECGQCETHCPQNIEIIKTLAIVADKYESKSE